MPDKPALTTSRGPCLNQRQFLTFTRNPLSTCGEQIEVGGGARLLTESISRPN